jgi:hypothetical protein
VTKKKNLKFLCTCSEKEKPCSHERIINARMSIIRTEVRKAEQNYAQRIFDDLSRCSCLESHGCIHAEDLDGYKRKWRVK